MIERYGAVDTLSSDLIAHHFDSGVPWPEAYKGLSYHQNVERDIKYRVKRLRKEQDA